MSKLVGIIMYTGAACVSPIEPMAGGTLVYRTPCAQIVQVQSANPYKIAQQPNVITAAAAKPKAVKKAVEKAKRKATKKRRKARR
jgi:hypothetical protein